MDQPKIERLLRLMKLMTGNVNYTIEELAQKLDTSYRSIYRYIDSFKSAGFVVHKLQGGVYKLGKESRYFKEISQLIHFTDEEAHMVNQLIDGIDNTNVLKENLRRKLTSVYNCTSLASSIVKGRNAENVNRLIEAIENHRQVVLEEYSSTHTKSIRDRVVEPFGFTTNYVQVWCYEVDSGQNKLFNTVRIGSVRDVGEWQFEKEHKEGYIDIFRHMGFTTHRIRLELGVLAHNLLVEEYPLAERDIRQVGNSQWLLDTEVCNYIGVTRFFMGLWSDIRIVDSPELEAYIKEETLKLFNNFLI